MIAAILVSVSLLFSPQVDKKKQAADLAEKGYKLIQETRFNEAVDIFNDAIKLDKNCREAHLGKGIAYYKSGDYNPRDIFPEEFIKRAIKIDPDYLEAKIHLGWAYYQRFPHDVDLWGGHFKKLIENEPVSGSLILEIVKFYDNLINYTF